MSKMTLIGLNNFDSSLFNNLVLPAGVERQTVIDNILLRSGEFEVLYADFDFNKNLIGLLSQKWYRTIDKWFKALQINYEPLENYDRYEEYDDSGNVSAHDTTNASGNGTTQTDVSAYDSVSYQPKDKVSSNSESNSSANSSSNSANHHVGHLHGNIGVTTSQQMLQSELDIALFNLYDQIATLFLAELVIPIY